MVTRNGDRILGIRRHLGVRHALPPGTVQPRILGVPGRHGVARAPWRTLSDSRTLPVHKQDPFQASCLPPPSGEGARRSWPERRDNGPDHTLLRLGREGDYWPLRDGISSGSRQGLRPYPCRPAKERVGTQMIKDVRLTGKQRYDFWISLFEELSTKLDTSAKGSH